MAKFTPSAYVGVYRSGLFGHKLAETAEALGLGLTTLRRWMQERPELRAAYDEGRADRKAQKQEQVAQASGAKEAEGAFGDYVYRALPENLQDLWDEIHAMEAGPTAIARTQALLREEPTRARQRIFIQALIAKRFSVTGALCMTATPLAELERWKLDPDFAALCEELSFHRDNFFEDAFLAKVAEGDTACVIHAAKTKLKHRGYNDRIEVEHTGTVDHHAHTIDVLALDLSTECRQELLRAIEAQEAAGAQLTS